MGSAKELQPAVGWRQATEVQHVIPPERSLATPDAIGESLVRIRKDAVQPGDFRVQVRASSVQADAPVGAGCRRGGTTDRCRRCTLAVSSSRFAGCVGRLHDQMCSAPRLEDAASGFDGAGYRCGDGGLRPGGASSRLAWCKYTLRGCRSAVRECTTTETMGRTRGSPVQADVPLGQIRD